MTMDSQVTLRDLIKYYSKCEDNMQDCENTIQFLKKYKCEGNYAKLASLMSGTKEIKSRKVGDDELFFAYMLGRNQDNEYEYETDLVARVDIFNPYVDKEKSIISQKWHFLISLLAFLDVSNNKPKINNLMGYLNSPAYKNEKIEYDFDFKDEGNENGTWKITNVQGYSYVGLKVWMAEAAGMEIKKIVDNAIKFIDAGDRKKACKEIDDNIKFQQVLEKINEKCNCSESI